LSEFKKSKAPKLEKREETSFKVLDVLSRRLRLLLREGPTLIFEMFYNVILNFLHFCPGFRIRIRIGSGFNRVNGSGSGIGIRIRIQEGKNDPRK
jgi:hypothetical protein